MRTFKLYLLLAAVLTALCFTLFIIVSAVSSIGQDYDLYKSLSPDNMSQFKKTNFITSYTYLTGDYSFAMSLGYEKSTIESLVNQQYGSQFNASSYGDARDVFTSYLLALKSQGASMNYSQTQRYTNAEISINGKTIPANTQYRLDCSSMSMACAYLMGLTSSPSSIKNDSRAIGPTCTSIPSGTTYGDLPVGTILWRDGHVAIIIAVTNEYVYELASGGSGGPNVGLMASGGWDNGTKFKRDKTESVASHNFTKYKLPN